MAGGGNFIHRVMSYVANELIVNGLANSPAFQRFAVRTSKRIENVSVKGMRSYPMLLINSFGFWFFECSSTLLLLLLLLLLNWANVFFLTK
ncbi:unnamed protein product [Coffea canephora]|uniref:Uncharacterized protein n=1 Tax=Coffea canephora TaxID=49390 RepID=A0A068UFQ4_COFCA|nr:unnamed protein product [Coffea canephora]